MRVYVEMNSCYSQDEVLAIKSNGLCHVSAVLVVIDDLRAARFVVFTVSIGASSSSDLV